MMNIFKIVPLHASLARKIRQTMVDAFNNPVIAQPATGRGPCRVSLKPFEKGVDTRLLFKHSPFELENAYNQPGPVFIQKKDVEEYSDIYRFPPEIKADIISFPLTLIGYSKDQMMVLTEPVGNKDVDELIAEIFEQRPDVEYLHARNSRACCYICKIERV
ncbi:hypothetical protein ACVW0P_002216 [Mucilaginibacter sp. UYNi724]